MINETPVVTRTRKSIEGEKRQRDLSIDMYFKNDNKYEDPLEDEDIKKIDQLQLIN